MCNHESKMNRWIKSNYGPVIVVINSQSHRGLRATQCPIRFRFKYSWGTSGVEFLTLRPFVCFEMFPFLQNQTSRQHHQLDASVSIKFAYNFSRVAQTRSLSCDCFYDNWDWVVSGMGWLLVWKKAFCLFLDTRFTRKFIPQWSMPKTVRTNPPPEKTGLIENITLTHCLQTSIWRSHLLWTEHAYNLLFQSDVVIPGFQAGSVHQTLSDIEYDTLGEKAHTRSTLFVNHLLYSG